MQKAPNISENMAEKLRTPEVPKLKFKEKLEAQWKKGNFVCVGLDTDMQVVNDIFKDVDTSTVAERMFRFNKGIIDATANKVCAFKPNVAFYEAEGADGHNALKRTIAYIKENHPSVLVILDAKRADIGNTNNGYVKAAFDELNADAITVNPYFGEEAMLPFLERTDKGIIVLVRTSNSGKKELQDLPVGDDKTPLYQVIAHNVATSWNKNGNCAVVAGATGPEELAKIRNIVGDMPILIPGIGAQGGELEATVKAGKDSRNMGMIINSSRGIIFASRDSANFAQAARKATQDLRFSINKHRNE